MLDLLNMPITLVNKTREETAPMFLEFGNSHCTNVISAEADGY
jgi:hypothetical protein